MLRLFWKAFSVLMLMYNANAGFVAYADDSYGWASFHATFFVVWVMILWEELQTP